MSEALNTDILEAIQIWNNSIGSTKNFPHNIIALNFGLQRVYDSDEIYLDGFAWYDEKSEIWLFDVEWTPARNYLSLTTESLKLDILHILQTFKELLSKQIKTGELKLPSNVSVVTVCLSGGQPIRIV